MTIKNWNQWKIIISRLSRDAIVISLTLFSGIILAEALLPGIISQKITLTLIAIPLFLFLAIYLIFLAQWDSENKNQKPTRVGKIVSLIFVIFITLLASYKFRLWEIAVITIVMAAIIILFYKNFSSEKQE